MSKLLALLPVQCRKTLLKESRFSSYATTPLFRIFSKVIKVYDFIICLLITDYIKVIKKSHFSVCILSGLSVYK